MSIFLSFSGILIWVPLICEEIGMPDSKGLWYCLSNEMQYLFPVLQ